ncbi:hypothetical protein FQN60_014945 [Etheostoma spectabile]|uniref:Uncharacterized protein n=1 Tax=Etheostoma spectabile TaxID=54343 RepID=A0A5J5CPW1_9PERO|nr:hypothetical protein FQN60_014945 [Etheostoma spectabile]
MRSPFPVKPGSTNGHSFQMCNHGKGRGDGCDREKERKRSSVRWEKVLLCAVPRCSPNHIRANESIPPPVMAAPARGPRKEREEEGGRKSGKRVEI